MFLHDDYNNKNSLYKFLYIRASFMSMFSV